MSSPIFRTIIVGCSAALALTACSGGTLKVPEKQRSTDMGKVYERGDTLFGKDGLTFDSSKSLSSNDGGSGIGVNAFLWRASLDTISFMPITLPDPFGGVIITDWFSPAESATERFKINVYILGRALRADGLRVSVFRQVRDAAGGWRDTAVPDDMATQIEDSILTKARQLRNEATNAQ